LSPFVPLTRERALENARCFRIVATKKPKGGAPWRHRAEEDEEEENEMEGSTKIHLLRHTERTLGCTVFVGWLDGQMTMGPWGPNNKIKVLAVCVCVRVQLRRSAGVSQAQRISIVWNVQSIYTSSSVIALMSEARIDMFSLDSSTEHLPTQISIFSRNRYPKHRRHKTDITEENTRIDLDQDRRSADSYRSFQAKTRYTIVAVRVCPLPCLFRHSLVVL
jgi:hypothetical protein